MLSLNNLYLKIVYTSRYLKHFYCLYLKQYIPQNRCIIHERNKLQILHVEFDVLKSLDLDLDFGSPVAADKNYVA